VDLNSPECLSAVQPRITVSKSTWTVVRGTFGTRALSYAITAGNNCKPARSLAYILSCDIPVYDARETPKVTYYYELNPCSRTFGRFFLPIRRSIVIGSIIVARWMFA